MATVEDHQKYFCALASRSVRRVGVKVRYANLDHLYCTTTAGNEAL